MDWSDLASLALAIFLVLVGFGLFYMFFRLGGLFGQLDDSVEEITDETVPILTRVQVTVDEVNAQLGHVDEIMVSAVNATKSAESAASSVSKAVTAPARALSGATASASEALRSFKARRAAGRPEQAPTGTPGQAPAVTPEQASPVKHESPY